MVNWVRIAISWIDVTSTAIPESNIRKVYKLDNGQVRFEYTDRTIDYSATISDLSGTSITNFLAYNISFETQLWTEAWAQLVPNNSRFPEGAKLIEVRIENIQSSNPIDDFVGESFHHINDTVLKAILDATDYSLIGSTTTDPTIPESTLPEPTGTLITNSSHILGTWTSVEYSNESVHLKSGNTGLYNDGTTCHHFQWQLTSDGVFEIADNPNDLLLSESANGRVSAQGIDDFGQSHISEWAPSSLSESEFLSGCTNI